MKKIVILLIVLVTLTGCQSSKEKEFKKAALKYAEKYNIYENVDTYVIELKNIIKANEIENIFSIDNIKKCDDNSSVSITYKEKQIENIEIELICK
ncbi:MAG: hypothetical protein IJZ36_04470 [Bacilli bacterium]|nr:hypothetical protein [Bacilli bacterium]